MMTVLDRIKADLESPHPGRVEWRVRLESAVFEIERLLAALENARRDLLSISPKAGSRSPLRKVAEEAAKRIEAAIGNQQRATDTSGTKP